MSFPPPLPHGPITPVVEGVYLVRGSFRMGPTMSIGRTMTIVQDPDGLTILNAVRLNAEGEAQLERLGRVKHLVKLSDSHGVDEPYYVERYQPEVWALPSAKLGKLVATQTLGATGPVADSVVLQLPGVGGWLECALWIKHGGGTLVACDVLQNHADGEGTSFIGRIMTPLLGFKGGVIVAPMWRKYQKVSGQAVRSAMENVLAQKFENLVTGHGPAVVGGAGELVRAAVERAAVA